MEQEIIIVVCTVILRLIIDYKDRKITKMENKLNELKKLASLVKEMREAQNNFFRTRHKNHLDRSRILEAQVDQAIKEILDNQIKMF